MKLSVVIICWNDADYIVDCIDSLYAETPTLEFEIIVTDNGSTDGSIQQVRRRFPRVRILENGRNLGFAGGNNAGFQGATGEYVLILNPDTIILNRAIEKLVAYADLHPEAGAAGCRVLNPDGSFQDTAQPIPTVWRYLVAALGLRKLGRISESFCADTYENWNGRSDREIGFQAGCMLLVRNGLLKTLGGFDDRFFHQFEDAVLCYRIWQVGYSIRYCPGAEIVHIGGRNRGGYPMSVIVETERSKYKFFAKHHGNRAASQIRYVSIIGFGLRYVVGRFRLALKWSDQLQEKIQTFREVLRWNWNLDPTRFITAGEEPPIEFARATGKAAEAVNSP